MNAKATWFALGCSLLGAGVLHLYLARYEQEVAGGSPTAVVVVTRDIALGDLVTRAALDARELPERYLEERHIRFDDLERIVGTRATAAVGSGSALLWSDLDVSQDGRTLSGLVRTGMRAFTLPEREVSFDGLLRPGDRVDVLFTEASGTAGTVTLLENALVLTVGGNLGETASGDAHAAQQPGRVTLSVTIEQAQRLAHSEQRGVVRLALRNPQDLVLAEGGTGVNEAELTSARAARTRGAQ